MTVEPHVTLVGLRCSGKSSVGRALAELLGRPFVDLDEALAERWERPVGELLVWAGPLTFRDLEQHELALRLAPGEASVLSPGGGAVERAASRARLALTRCFWLDAPPEVLGSRLARDPTPRPALLSDDAAGEVAELARRRAPLYAEVAEARLDACRPVEELAEEIAARLRGARI